MQKECTGLVPDSKLLRTALPSRVFNSNFEAWPTLLDANTFWITSLLNSPQISQSERNLPLQVGGRDEETPKTKKNNGEEMTFEGRQRRASESSWPEFFNDKKKLRMYNKKPHSNLHAMLSDVFLMLDGIEPFSHSFEPKAFSFVILASWKRRRPGACIAERTMERLFEKEVEEQRGEKDVLRTRTIAFELDYG